VINSRLLRQLLPFDTNTRRPDHPFRPTSSHGDTG